MIMAQGKPITQLEKESVISLHRKGVSHAEIARRLCIGSVSVSRILRNSGETLGTFAKSDPEIDRRVAELYPDHSQREIAELLGLGISRPGKIARRLGLTHSPETEERLKVKQMEKRMMAHTPEVWERAISKCRRKRRMEMRRLLGGEKQQTRYRLSIMPKKQRACLQRLARKFGYIYTLNSYVVCYDEQTDRRLNMLYDEDYYARKYGVRFMPIE